MTFYKLIKTIIFEDGSIKHKIQYEHGVLYVSPCRNDFIVCETGELLTPMYDSRTTALTGFTNFKNT